METYPDNLSSETLSYVINSKLYALQADGKVKAYKTQPAHRVLIYWEDAQGIRRAVAVDGLKFVHWLTNTRPYEKTIIQTLERKCKKTSE